MFLILCALFITLVYIYCQLRHDQVNEKTHNWPEPPAWPVIGHMHHLLAIAVGRNQFARALQLLQRYGAEHRLKLWFGTKLYLFNCNPKDLQPLLSAPELLAKTEDYAVFKNWLSEGLLASHVPKWTVRRKMLQPAFSYGILKEFVDIFELQTINLVENLRVIAKNKLPCDLFDKVSLCTLDIVCETALGVSIGAQSEKKSAYVDAVHEIHEILKQRISNIFYRYKALYKYTEIAEKEKRVLSTLHGFSERLIGIRRRELNDMGNKTQLNGNSTTDDLGTRRKLSFLDTLLKVRVNDLPLSDTEIREEVDNIIFGGFDTTATNIKFLIYNLAKHNEWQQNCRDEILEICGPDKSNHITFEQLRQLDCVEMCIKETLRLYPPAPMTARKALADCDINGYCIPAGSSVVISPIYAGRCEEFFPDAKTFKPDRFEKDAYPKIDANTFLPFMLGPRSCIGQKYAMLMMKMIVSQLLRNFEFENVDKEQNADRLLSFVITLHTKRPLFVKIKEL